MILPATAEKTGGLCMPCHKKPLIKEKHEQYLRDISDKDLIDAGRRWVDHETWHKYKTRELERFKTAYFTLLTFFSENKLLTIPFEPESIKDWYHFEIRYSHLTQKGIQIINLCHHKWLEGIGRGNKPDYLGRWKRELKNL